MNYEAVLYNSTFSKGTILTAVGEAGSNVIPISMATKQQCQWNPGNTNKTKSISTGSTDSNQFLATNAFNVVRTTAGFIRTGSLSSPVTIIKVTMSWNGSGWSDSPPIYGWLPPNVARPTITFISDYSLALNSWNYITLRCEHVSSDEGIEIDSRCTFTEYGGTTI